MSVAFDGTGDIENYPSVVTIYINASLASRLQKTPRVLRNPWGLGRFATVGTDEAWQSEAAPTGNGDGCTTYDHTAPTITSLNVPARTSSGFAVTWSAQDNLTGISHHDVQYKNESGAWADWLTSTHATQSVFTGPGGHAYTFRVRATDGAGNASGWQTSGPVTVLQEKKHSVYSRLAPNRRFTRGLEAAGRFQIHCRKAAAATV